MEQIYNLYMYIFQGLKITLQVTFLSLSIGFLLGFFLATIRVYGGKLLGWIAAVYSILFRAVPLLLMVLILFFVITSIVNLSAFWAGTLALCMASGAYQSEIFRGAILAVPQGQMLAARAIGMNKLQAIGYIIIPQALRMAIAPWSNEAAIILKDSSMVYILGVPEILRQAQYYSARTHQPFLAYITVATIYLVLVIITNRTLDYVEKRYTIPSLIKE